MKTTKPAASLLLCKLLIGGFIFRGIIAYFLPAGFDEAYYFLYTQHLDWSYFDHPPAVAWTTGLGIWLTGTVSPFTMRLGAMSLFTGCLWLLYATGRHLFGESVGLLSCAIASLTPLFFLSFGTLTAPDNALMFFWSLALYLCSREFFPVDPKCYRPTKKLVWISLCVGLACLGKYHGFVLGLCLVGFCSTSHRYRQALGAKWLWLGVLVFAVAVFPIFYWNAQHEWISFRFQLGDRFSEYDADPGKFSVLALLGAIASQVGYLSPSIALPLWWVSLRALLRTLHLRTLHIPLKGQTNQTKLTELEQLNREKVNFLLWSGLPVAILFTLVGGYTHTFPAWPAPGLWSLTILLGLAAEKWSRRRVERWLKITGWVMGTLLLFALTHITLGTLQKPSDYAIFGGVVSAAADPSTELIDAMQLRRLLSESPEFRDAIATSSFILTREYWLSGYFAIAMPKNVLSANALSTEGGDATMLPVTSFTVDPRGHAFWFNPEDYIGKDALLMSFSGVPQSEVVDQMSPYFESITLLAELSTLRGGEPSETFSLYQAKTLLTPYAYPY